MSAEDADPVTGTPGEVVGVDCRDLNPRGECETFRRKFPIVGAVLVFLALYLAVFVGVHLAIAAGL